MKILDIFKKIVTGTKRKYLGELGTIEERSFWILAPVVFAVGISGLFTSNSYGSALPTILSAILCSVIPVVLMLIVAKRQNYHIAYPLLCILTGGVCIPATFYFSGGFLSGMPLFCVVITVVSVLCEHPKWRIASFILSWVGNTIAFLCVFKWGTPYPIAAASNLYTSENSHALNAIYGDILFGYYLSTLAMYIVIGNVIGVFRRYKLNQDALTRYFDSEKRNEIFKKVVRGESNLKIKSEHRKAAILFADISNFTSVSEKMPSDLIADFLNEFFTAAGKYIHETNGIIDKYIGDCIMAYWMEETSENCVLSAVEAMLKLKSEILQKSQYIYEKYNTELNFSVGISYGDVIFGDIGSDSMHDFTIIGDAVNAASRIQEFAVSGEMIISDSGADMIKDKIIVESVETEHFFKGKNNSIDLYRIIGWKNEEQRESLVSLLKSFNGYKLHICGCRGSFPVSGLRFSEYGGETSCYILKKDDYALIVDCGTGLKNGMKILENCKHIDILLTHVHYDHILGFLMSKFPQSATVRIFGRFSAWSNNENVLNGFMKRPYWPVQIRQFESIDVKLGSSIELNNEVNVTFYPSDHPDNACVIKILCKKKKITFLADCENADLLDPEIAANSDILFFDGMFDENDSVDHKGWGHGTWQNAIRYVCNKNVKKLVITHHNPEVADQSLLLKEEKAREIYPNVSFAKSGDVFTL